jgi:hypothetical protein
MRTAPPVSGARSQYRVGQTWPIMRTSPPLSDSRVLAPLYSASLNRERPIIPGADTVPNVEGHTHGRAICERPDDPAWSQTLACAEAPCTGTGRSHGGGVKGGDQEERRRANHTPDTGPGSCDPGARSRTEGSSAKEEGEVHRALPPPQRRSSPGGVPRAQARRRPGMDGLTWQAYAADLDQNLTCRREGRSTR